MPNETDTNPIVDSPEVDVQQNADIYDSNPVQEPTVEPTDQPVVKDPIVNKEVTPAVIAKPTIKPDVSKVEPTDDERYAKIAAQAAAAVIKQQAPVKLEAQTQQEPDLTEDEIKSILNPVVVDQNMLSEIGFEGATPQQVQGFQKFANSIVRNATSVAALITEQKIRSVLEANQGLFQHYEKAQQKEYQDTFYGKYPQLGNYKKFVSLAANQISPNKPDGSHKTVDEVGEEISGLVNSMLSEIGVNGEAGQLQAQQPSQVPKMAAMQVSGRGNASNASTKQNDPNADIYN